MQPMQQMQIVQVNEVPGESAMQPMQQMQPAMMAQPMTPMMPVPAQPMMQLVPVPAQPMMQPIAQPMMQPMPVPTPLMMPQQMMMQGQQVHQFPMQVALVFVAPDSMQPQQHSPVDVLPGQQPPQQQLPVPVPMMFTPPMVQQQMPQAQNPQSQELPHVPSLLTQHHAKEECPEHEEGKVEDLEDRRHSDMWREQASEQNQDYEQRHDDMNKGNKISRQSSRAPKSGDETKQLQPKQISRHLSGMSTDISRHGSGLSEITRHSSGISRHSSGLSELSDDPAPPKPSVGSSGHPDLCRPCLFQAQGLCTKGESCGFCHIPHPKRPVRFDKLHRETLKRMPFEHLVGIMLPVLHQKSDNIEEFFDVDLRSLVHDLWLNLDRVATPAVAPSTEGDKGEPGCDGTWQRSRRAERSLVSVLYAMGFRSLLAMLAPKVPEDEDKLRALVEEIFQRIHAQRRGGDAAAAALPPPAAACAEEGTLASDEFPLMPSRRAGGDGGGRAGRSRRALGAPQRCRA